jgi:hypothetical protein
MNTKLTKKEAGRLGGLKRARSSREEKNLRIEAYNRNPKVCGNSTCSVELPYDKRQNKFCSKSCSASTNNKGVRRHGKSPGQCLNCNRNLNSSKKIYCNNTCQRELDYKSYIRKWLDKKVSGNTSREMFVSNHVKRWLRENRGDSCQRCSWSEINPSTGKIPTQIHHIDGNSRNSHEDNLEILCPNCHSLTETFGNLNRGRGRVERYNS